MALGFMKKVCEGAYYTTLDGSIVGPAQYNASSVEPGRVWRIGGCGYYSNGTCFGEPNGWPLELAEEIPEKFTRVLMSRAEHDAKMRAYERRVEELEAALAAFSGLPKALKTLEKLAKL